MSEPLIEFVRGEYDYLRGRNGRDFFLSIDAYVTALRKKRRVRQILEQLQEETKNALKSYVEEQNAFIDEAKALRCELAERAPEVDNSDWPKPDEASHEWTHYAYDSFAGFDELAEADMAIAYPTLPQDDIDPGPVGDLLGILRGRLRAAEYGEDAVGDAAKIRDDLADLRLRVRNLAERRSHALRRYQYEARTLPGVAFGRLVHFSSNLNPDPVILAEGEDMATVLNRMLQEMWTAGRTVRKLVNNEAMDDYEREAARTVEQTLKNELDRLHQELTRRLPLKPGPVIRFIREQSAKIAIGVCIGVVTALILVYVFGFRG